MSPNEIQALVLDVLKEIQILSGRPWEGLDASATPIGELDGFDSLTGVEATVMIEQKLGGQDLDLESLFVSEDGKHALTVQEVAERIAKLLVKSGAKV
jgi:acyl carrier protein